MRQYLANVVDKLRSRILGRVLKQGILRYEAGVLMTQLRNSVRRLLVTNEAK